MDQMTTIPDSGPYEKALKNTKELSSEMCRTVDASHTRFGEIGVIELIESAVGT